MALISDPVSAIAGVAQAIIDRFPSQAQKDAANLQLAQMYMNGDLQKMTTAAGVITAEAQSVNKLTNSWRPMLMYVFMAIIVNNYIIAPYMQAMFHFGLQLQIPVDMWDLLKLGVGGYVVGRSAEKVASQFATAKAPDDQTVPDSNPSAIVNSIKDIFQGH